MLLLPVHSLLLLLTSGFHRRDVRSLRSRTNSTTTGAHHHLSTLAWLGCIGAVGASRVLSTFLSTQWARLRHRLHGRAHGCCDSDGVGIVASSTFYAVARRQESVKSLDQFRIAGEQLANSSNDPGSIDGTALEIFHYIKEAVVNIRVIGELHFDLIKIAQSVVENRLLALALCLTLCLALTLAHLLLLSSLRLSLGKRHEQSGRVALVLSLSGLNRSTSEHVIGPRRAANRELSLCLGPRQAWVSKQAIRTMNCARPHGHGLVQVHRLTLRLVLRRLFHPLALLLPVLPVLLFLDVDLLNLASSLAVCRSSLVGSLA